MDKQTSQEIMSHVDHTILAPDTTKTDIDRIVDEAIRTGCAAVCVAPYNVKFAVERAEQQGGIPVASVISFPHGNSTTPIKCAEARQAINDGASEIDMVANVGAIKDELWGYVEQDIRAVVEEMNGDAKLKVIVETSLLTKDEIVKMCEICQGAGADYIKTSTGYSDGGATAEDVKLMSDNAGPVMKVKASGGIRTLEDAKKMIDAGADRIGASKLVAEYEKEFC